MGTIYRFEDMPLWQGARGLCNIVFNLVKKSVLFKADFRFRDQVKASAGSVMDNIAEGFERSSRLEFVNFLGMAKGSTGEIRSQLYRALDNHYLDKSEVIPLIEAYEKLSREIAGFMAYLNQTTIKGEKFKNRRKIE